MMNIGKRLEAYTIQRPQEILLVTLEMGDETEEIVIFKGFSSSLVQPTNPDPDIPIIQDEAVIINIERVRNPYNPSQPNYIQRGLTLDDMETLLQEAGV